MFTFLHCLPCKQSKINIFSNHGPFQNIFLIQLEIYPYVSYSLVHSKILISIPFLLPPFSNNLIHSLQSSFFLSNILLILFLSKILILFPDFSSFYHLLPKINFIFYQLFSSTSFFPLVQNLYINSS